MLLEGADWKRRERPRLLDPPSNSPAFTTSGSYADGTESTSLMAPGSPPSQFNDAVVSAHSTNTLESLSDSLTSCPSMVLNAPSSVTLRPGQKMSQMFPCGRVLGNARAREHPLTFTCPASIVSLMALVTSFGERNASSFHLLSRFRNQQTRL